MPVAANEDRLRAEMAMTASAGLVSKGDEGKPRLGANQVADASTWKTRGTTFGG